MFATHCPVTGVTCLVLTTPFMLNSHGYACLSQSCMLPCISKWESEDYMLKPHISPLKPIETLTSNTDSGNAPRLC